MTGDFFLGFAAHAHTKNEIGTDPDSEMELRNRNNTKEAQELTESILDKIEKDISDEGYSLRDVKLLILYSSYRGEAEEKDRLICERILRVIEKRFKDHSANQLRLIGHTTAGEIENEDLELKEVAGIGYNGLSLLALVTNLPIGVGRTWGLRTEREAVEQGREMAHDVWLDYNQNADLREHIKKSKTLLVLTQGPKSGKLGYEHFLATGIANFLSSTREARIANVIGGATGDGCIGGLFHQFYGKLGEQPKLKILEDEAVCALITNVSEPSVGVDAEPVKKIGKSHRFYFDREAEPRFKYLKRIGNKDPRILYAKIVYENEAQISREKGRPIIDEKELFESISHFEGLPLHPVLCKYGFAFPFGNYTPTGPLRTTEQYMELVRPTRGHESTMDGYVVVIDDRKVQKGAHKVYNMLRENRGFSKRDVTFLVSCISRRLAEVMADSKTKTEAEILKETLSSTQVIGFLAYGELSFTYLLQEPYLYNFSCLGITLRSRSRKRKVATELKREKVGVSEVAFPGRITTGYEDLDDLLFGGLPRNYAVILTSPSCDERDLLIKRFLEAGAKNGEVTFYITTRTSGLKNLAEGFQSDFYLFICNPQADKIIRDMPNAFKLKGVENLTDINIALSSAFHKLKSLKGPRRACIEIVSDVLLQHQAVQTRRWLNALIPELRSNSFTTLAVMDPGMHTPQEARAVLGLFDGEINIYEKETEKGLEKFLKIKKMTNQKYSKSELLLQEEKLQK